ncbi:MAG: FapA family protein [Alistipes sp.]|nr:FapA family protein [Alistipes sp.]
MVNGYFQFENQDDVLYMNIYAPKDGGVAVDMEQVIRYIDKVNITPEDLTVIKTEIANCTDSARIKIGEKCLPNNELGEYTVSNDNLHVEVEFYPGFVGAGTLTAQEIISDLNNLGVQYGIKPERINELIRQREYFTKYEIVEATPPVDGVDGYITYHFEAEKKATPRIKEDGSVDFHDLDTLNHVKAGDCVATLTPEIQGTPGTDVFGKSIAPRRARKVVFKHGKNLAPSEDGLSLLTEVSGHVTLEGGKIFVSNVLELVNVDASTGDINYDGNVVVTGDVQAGFSVKASGDIEVRGIVEGAVVEAGGNLTLGRGVQGMSKAVLKCNGNLVARFLESVSTVSVGGNLETDTILHSKIEARGSVTALGKNGLIIGGDVRSAMLITAKFIGNEMGTATVVGVGVDPATKRQVEALKNEITELNESKVKLNQLITGLRKKQETDGKLEPNKQEMFQKSTRNLIMTEHTLTAKRKEFDELSQLVNEEVNARIKVTRTAYPGTKLMFGDTYMFIKNRFDYCQFLKFGADIKSMPL